MILCSLLSALLFSSIPFAYAFSLLNVEFLLGVAFLGGVAAVFFETAYTAYLPSILMPADQANGNALLHGSASAAQVVGSGSGGVIVQVFGAANAMLANAATFLVTLICLTGIRDREDRKDRAKRAEGAIFKEIGEGWRLIFHDPWLRTFTLVTSISNLAYMGCKSIWVIFLVRDIGLSAGSVGALIAAASAGGVGGAFLVRGVSERLGTARAALLFQGALPIFALLIPLATAGIGVSFFFFGAASISAGFVAGNVIKASFRQSYCPPEILGRLTATSAFLVYGAMPIGALLGGFLGESFGVRCAIWITAVGTALAPSLILLFSPFRSVRDLPTGKKDIWIDA